jgi:hypothetical protein
LLFALGSQRRKLARGFRLSGRVTARSNCCATLDEISTVELFGAIRIAPTTLLDTSPRRQTIAKSRRVSAPACAPQLT